MKRLKQLLRLRKQTLETAQQVVAAGELKIQALKKTRTELERELALERQQASQNLLFGTEWEAYLRVTKERFLILDLAVLEAESVTEQDRNKLREAFRAYKTAEHMLNVALEKEKFIINHKEQLFMDEIALRNIRNLKLES